VNLVTQQQNEQLRGFENGIKTRHCIDVVFNTQIVLPARLTSCSVSRQDRLVTFWRRNFCDTRQDRSPPSSLSLHSVLVLKHELQ
jgi:hypothetical protein